MQRHRGARSGAALAATTIVLAVATADVGAVTSYDWPQFNGDARHSGNNTSETILSAGNVGKLQQLFQITLPEVADSAPVLLGAVSTSAGSKDLLFVNTLQGRLMALDAHTGAIVWSFIHAASPCGSCITMSSPAIDPTRRFVYAYGLDGSAHKHDVSTGAETSGGGWPAVATAKPDVEKGASSLTVATAHNGTSYLYVAHSGYFGDGGDYQGHLTAINLATGAQSVFNAVCSNQTAHFVESGTPDCPSQRSGIWGRAGVVYDSDIDKIFAATGNGDFNPSNGYWGDSVIALNPDGTGAGGQPVDSYTPADFQTLEDGDADLGSTAPLVLPTPAGFPVPHVGVQGGKDGTVRLLNMDNLSNQGGGPLPGRTAGELATVQVPGAVFTAPAAWVNPADGSSWVFVATSSAISAYQLTAAGSSVALTTKWTSTPGATSPLVANSVLYLARGSSLQALSPTSGVQLWSASIGTTHWQSPVLANGVLYALDQSAHLTAFALPPAPAIPASPGRTLALAVAGLLLLALHRRRAATKS
jgi:outer membrane protein assembly factor BamB